LGYCRTATNGKQRSERVGVCNIGRIMPCTRLIGAYFLFVGLPLSALFLILVIEGRFTAASAAYEAPPTTISAVTQAALGPGASLLVLQIIAVLITAQLMAAIFRKLAQPRVVGEIIAGIVLGPSVLGALVPAVSAALFPASSLDHLNLFSQVGLVIFMFLVGVSLDSDTLRHCGHAAILTSHASIALPFAFGAAVALFVYPALASTGVGFCAFALFMGAAMSITALPVLAWILMERDLIRSEAGTMAVACAAADDLSGWCILALISALVRGSDSGMPPWVTIAGSLEFVGGMLLVIRPLLNRYGDVWLKDDGTQYRAMAGVLLLALSSSCISEILGLHLLFGGFFTGAILPKNLGIVKQMREQLEPITQTLFLPLFFSVTGLRTSVRLLRGTKLWATLVVIIGVAVAGKMGGSTLAARCAGIPWREAAAIGALLNTRGSIELVMLNIGLDLHIIPPALFTMMVLMAVATTLMTSPLLSRLRRSLVQVEGGYMREEQSA
jgi:Kef-type K+ transport system membrane component KefB